ncbi:MAG: hypothetical protein KF725_11260 [Cyclobacteriaceae bacterium]|nr:hypothetical protein [Cyclobacteriaceae bacterium]UYN86283.1 MAG: hypothetical protein KIT51_15655 [Cyclobacteriaceae bacterium]
MKTLILLPVMLFITSALCAQDKLTRYFPAGLTDGQVLIDNYLRPLGEDICILPNNGWYTTAKTHKKWGFDLNITVNSVFVSNEKKYFDLPQLSNGLTYQGSTTGNTTQIPTFYADEGEWPLYRIEGGANNGVVFQGAEGSEPGAAYFIDAFFLPNIQMGLGLGFLKNTDLRVRFTPRTPISSVEVGSWGIGIMHDIRQHLKVVDENLFFLSVFVGYTKYSIDVDLSGGFDGTDQVGAISTSGFTGQILIGKDFKIISFYGAAGYETGKTSVDINGTYTVDSYFNSTGDFATLPQSFILSNPYSFNYNKSGMRFTAGTRLKLGPITFNGDYSFVGDRRVLTLGFGFTVK